MNEKIRKDDIKLTLILGALDEWWSGTLAEVGLVKLSSHLYPNVNEEEVIQDIIREDLSKLAKHDDFKGVEEEVGKILELFLAVGRGDCGCYKTEIQNENYRWEVLKAIRVTLNSMKVEHQLSMPNLDKEGWLDLELFVVLLDLVGDKKLTEELGNKAYEVFEG